MTTHTAPPPLARLIPPGCLVVSCQAPPASPFGNPEMIAAMAAAAHLGGASAIRADGPADIAAIAGRVPLPILGINKLGERDGVYITPTFESAAEVVRAGASMVAVDGTDRPRPGGETLERLVARVHDELCVPVMADCATIESAEFAARAGCDVLASTLAGYIGGPPSPEPDVHFVEQMADDYDLPVIAEGRYSSPRQVAEAFDAGAYAVVVGTAITNPIDITRRFVAATTAHR